MKHTFLRHTAVFLLCVVLAVAFLLAGACLPQDLIDENIRVSSAGMLEDGAYPVIADKSFASMLDYTTDALILAESKAATIAHPESIFTNPLYEYGLPSAVDNLYSYARDPSPQETGQYVQYWMGFRPVMRLLLCFLDYHQILRYTAVLFFVLLAAVMCSIARRLDEKAAFFFALSIILVRPHVIAVSLQFSCCFLMAFPAMLAVPKIHEKPRWESLFFLILGIATMYFDFYTTPVITFALPMTYLYLLKGKQNAPVSFRQVGVNALSWSAGYGFMWLAKLVLTSVLTSANGLGTGFASFSGRIGITKTAGLESYYNPITALRTVAASLYSDQEGKWILFGAVALAGLWVLYRLWKLKPRKQQFLAPTPLLLIAFLPILWFMIAAQPTANHHWFQYRSICATFWAGLMYLSMVLDTKEDPQT